VGNLRRIVIEFPPKQLDCIEPLTTKIAERTSTKTASISPKTAVAALHLTRTARVPQSVPAAASLLSHHIEKVITHDDKSC
jgi:hypothetical protein